MLEFLSLQTLELLMLKETMCWSAFIDVHFVVGAFLNGSGPNLLIPLVVHREVFISGGKSC